MLPCEIPSSEAVTSMIIRLSIHTISRTCSTFSSVVEDTGVKENISPPLKVRIWASCQILRTLHRSGFRPPTVLGFHYATGRRREAPVAKVIFDVSVTFTKTLMSLVYSRVFYGIGYAYFRISRVSEGGFSRKRQNLMFSRCSKNDISKSDD
ncbi:hypothetical protein TNCV_2703801 [Trichonephila clavipes]|nr:hypothetical protein TNCV_2703801 [Trichonephila clavipes]